ncbi:MAG: YkgJ family cysteine cluster protein [Lachnospiraceae bacterium]|nr:YkgJ family cysteine cluster protein [Lachnospiraceae bacterium]
MKRNVDINDISDGRFYGINDMAKLGCMDCAGCSACCHGMGATIVIDPYDFYRMSGRLKMNFEQMLAKHLELNVVDGVVLPNLRLSAEDEGCTFLNAEGRCTIHDARPGICRLFPLGRYYENHDYKYFLQVNECHKDNRTKVKISKWIDTPNYDKYRQFVIDWHYFLNDVEEKANSLGEQAKKYSLILLETFYMRAYDMEREFYEQYMERKKLCEMLFAKI